MIHSFSFPTRILLGQGAITAMAVEIAKTSPARALIVTDQTLVELGIVKQVTDVLDAQGIKHAVFADIHPNPLEEDCQKGIKAYRDNQCDTLIGIGGGSALDVAKVIKVLTSHPEPLSRYDDAAGGDQYITEPMPALYAVPTTAGTGSEVGRSGVVILKESGRKTVIFHPQLLPNIAALEPALTEKLPAFLTAATGIDAFTHAMEAYFAPAYHPICDGIALESMKLVANYLPKACKNGSDLHAREQMLLAASMGAIAFQKGLGMVHSLAHPLSAEYDTHHGLANALLLADSVALIESRATTADQRQRLDTVQDVFSRNGYRQNSLSGNLREFVSSVGIPLGLSKHKVPKPDLGNLAKLAFEDGIHKSNMVPVTEADLLAVYQAAY